MVSLGEQGQVLERMADAARWLEWPDQIVEATCAQMRVVSKMQIQTIDNDAWEEQIRSANPPSAMLSKLRSFATAVRPTFFGEAKGKTGVSA